MNSWPEYWLYLCFIAYLSCVLAGSEPSRIFLYSEHGRGIVLLDTAALHTAFTLPDCFAKTFTAPAFAVGRFFALLTLIHENRDNVGAAETGQSKYAE